MHKIALSLNSLSNIDKYVFKMVEIFVAVEKYYRKKFVFGTLEWGSNSTLEMHHFRSVDLKKKIPCNFFVRKSWELWSDVFANSFRSIYPNHLKR